jgi:hypothetical protein
MPAPAKVCQAVDDTTRAAAQWNGRELVVPATCGRSLDRQATYGLTGQLWERVSKGWQVSREANAPWRSVATFALQTRSPSQVTAARWIEIFTLFRVEVDVVVAF